MKAATDKKAAVKKEDGRKGKVAGTPLSAAGIRDLATIYLQDMAQRLLAVAGKMEAAQPKMATIDVQHFAMGTRGVENLIELVKSAEEAVEKSAKPSIRDVLLRAK